MFYLKTKYALVLVGMTLLIFPCRASAADGWYMGMDLGVAISPDVDVETGGLDDWTSSNPELSARCDVTLNPDRVQTEGLQCHDDPQPWGPMKESFDGGMGILAGAALGYRMGNFRIEGEYFYRNAAHDDTDVPRTADYDPSTDTQFAIVQDAVDDVLTHNFFANLYYDFHSDSKFTPYVGMGVGLASVTVEYRTLWHRNGISQTKVFDNTLPGGRELNQKLAGALLRDGAKLSDLLFGYQALAGVDYQISEPVSIGLKFRWADFGEFKDESHYDSLRNHASVAGNPPVPVTYYVRTDDIQFWGGSLNVKYAF